MAMIWLMRLLILAVGGLGADMIDPRRNFVGACRVWYPVIRDLRRFFIARVIVNDDGKGGTAPDPLVWCAGSKRKKRRVVEAVRDFAVILGPQRLWVGSWFRWPLHLYFC